MDFQDGLAKGKGCGSFQRVLGELVPPHLTCLFPAWLLLESCSDSQVLGKGRARASEDISMARQLSLGKMMRRFLPEWDMEQVRFDIGIGGRKFATGPGLGRKHLVFEDKGRELFPGHSIVQLGSTRVPSGIQGHLFMEDEASGHRAEGPSRGDLS